MKPTNKKLELKQALEKLGYKVYFSKGKVKLIRPWQAGSGVDWYTFREAYQMVKCLAGSGKSVHPEKRRAKEQTSGRVRTKIRDQLKTDQEDVACFPKQVFDVWKYD